MIPIFSNPQITIATIEDLAAIKYLLDSAYRGEASKQGWTTEANLISGNQRTDDESLLQVMQQTGSIFLKYTDAEKQINACVNLQKQGDKIYLGMFSVSPPLQGAGIGKQLLHAAEEYARQVDCVSIYMSVISVRLELVDWYHRHGYQEAGERKPFIEDAVTGKHLQALEFMTLEKTINNGTQ
ncbi:MAG: GNAT family N-acetyltransferase [Ferruginibacter sp.]